MLLSEIHYPYALRYKDYTIWCVNSAHTIGKYKLEYEIKFMLCGASIVFFCGL